MRWKHSRISQKYSQPQWKIFSYIIFKKKINRRLMIIDYQAEELLLHYVFTMANVFSVMSVWSIYIRLFHWVNKQFSTSKTVFSHSMKNNQFRSNCKIQQSYVTVWIEITVFFLNSLFLSFFCILKECLLVSPVLRCYNAIHLHKSMEQKVYVLLFKCL